MNQDDLNKLATAYVKFYSGVDIYSGESIYDENFDLINKEKEQYEWASEEVMDLAIDKSELLWCFILEVLSRNPPDEVLGMLAAGPLEDYLSYWAVEKIDVVEIEAKSNPAFSNLLGGVWQSSIPDKIWNRINKCTDRSGWDGL
jgi:hypothetical protein